MRAPGGGPEGAKALKDKWAAKGLTGQETGSKDKFVALTRNSPFKVSTLMSLAPLRPSEMGFDYGTMTRTEDSEYPNPVPYVHEFYRSTLMGLFSIDLRMLGRFYFVERTGYRHLEFVRMALAEEKKLGLYDNGRAFEFDLDTRKKRLAQLLEGLARISGGAKQAVHYTDVSPRLLLLGIAKGGNHLFGTSVGADKDSRPLIRTAALEEVAKVFKDDLLSGYYAGLAQGYLDEQRAALKEQIEKIPKSPALGHPVEALRNVIKDLDSQAEKWLE